MPDQQMPSPADVPIQRKRIFGWLANAQLAGLVGIASLLLSLYFWMDAKIEPSLYVLSDPYGAAQIVSVTTPNLQVRYKDIPVKGDVFVQQIKVWNRGKRSIKAVDVLDPIFLRFDSSVHLLDVSIKNEVRRTSGFEVSSPSLGLIKESQPLHSDVSLNWRILEQGDGATIQVIYEGAKDVNFTVQGAIEGQKYIAVNRRGAGDGKVADPQLRAILRVLFYVSSVMVVTFFYCGAKRTQLPREGRKARIYDAIRTVLFYLIIAAFIPVMGIVAYGVFTAPTDPPF